MHVIPLTWGELYRFPYPLSTPDTCRLYTWVTWALFLGWQPPLVSVDSGDGGLGRTWDPLDPVPRGLSSLALVA